jgi:predicted RNA-binding Zn ribbon-like protein
MVMRKRQQAPGELEHVRVFVNTFDMEEGEDGLDTPSALRAWLAEHGLLGGSARATAADLRDALEIREALRELLLANADHAPTPKAAATLDEAARRARMEVRFDADGGHLESSAGGVAGALGRLLAIVHGAMANGTWERLKACRRESCQWAFYDNTKNHSGVWCTMETCGNRAKAQAYRARHAAT